VCGPIDAPVELVSVAAGVLVRIIDLESMAGREYPELLDLFATDKSADACAGSIAGDLKTWIGPV
jgi:hypothetical protein